MKSPSFFEGLAALAVTGMFAAGCADPLPPDPRAEQTTMENPGLDKESETEAEMERISDLKTDPDEAVADSTASTTNFEGVVTEVQTTAVTLRQGEDKPQTFAVSPEVIVRRGEESKSGSAPLSSIEPGQRVELAAEREDAENTTIYVVQKITVLAEAEKKMDEAEKQDEPKTTPPEEPKAEDNKPEADKAEAAKANAENSNEEKSGDNNADSEKPESETADDSKETDENN
ncbi:hypothetical protein [Rubinisphaera sp. JC750]|uniref:hypothetical protein n=1 Tax=Rubinisphaera sp. JC750 TaxID=2898658 RepID=UPI001F3D0191|nr:hypothetical protein [Rubinisphaera sp. JC750]